METIHGPIAQLVAGGLIYQVTLASGMIVTSPLGFSQDKNAAIEPREIVSEDGTILSRQKGAK